MMTQKSKKTILGSTPSSPDEIALRPLQAVAPPAKPLPQLVKTSPRPNTHKKASQGSVKAFQASVRKSAIKQSVAKGKPATIVKSPPQIEQVAAQKPAPVF